jgi:GH18 family chitinase
MKIRKSSFSILFLLLISFRSETQTKTTNSATDFKIVVYIPLRPVISDSTQTALDYGFLNKITHVNLAFINPDTSGNFLQDIRISYFIGMAHAKNVKVLASIGGGGPHKYYSGLLKDDKRNIFISNLVSLVKKFDLDGIDVDIEDDDIDMNYENFIIALSEALSQRGKLLTAAIATVYKDRLADGALQRFNFINIMSYDRTGPWRPDNPGPHSPFAMAVDDLVYWNKVRSIPKEKLVLGLPFYGYGFSSTTTSVLTMDYKQIASSFPESVFQDSINLPGDVIMYYNGIPTIKRKTALAEENAGGVMIWQLLGDASGENSLLEAIHQVVYKK